MNYIFSSSFSAAFCSENNNFDSSLSLFTDFNDIELGYFFTFFRAGSVYTIRGKNTRIVWLICLFGRGILKRILETYSSKGADIDFSVEARFKNTLSLLRSLLAGTWVVSKQNAFLRKYFPTGSLFKCFVKRISGSLLRIFFLTSIIISNSASSASIYIGCDPKSGDSIDSFSDRTSISYSPCRCAVWAGRTSASKARSS